MSVSQRGSEANGPSSSEDYGLVLKAIEIVEVARCRPVDEAQALVVDLLREVVRAVPRRARAKHVSGCMAATGECPTCGDQTRLFRKAGGGLTCGACMMDELLIVMQTG